MKVGIFGPDVVHYGALQRLSVLFKELYGFTDNNPLTYVLSSAKLNATGFRWVGELADSNFSIKYQPGKRHTDSNSFS